MHVDTYRHLTDECDNYVSMDITYVCVYSHHIVEQSMKQPGKVVNPARGQLNRENEYFPFPRSHLRIWSRQTGSAIPSGVSLLILHIQTESGAYSRDSSRFPRRHLFIYTAIRHRIRPEFIGSRSCVPMAFPAESPPAQGQWLVRLTGAVFVGHHGPINVCLSFLIPTIDMKCWL